MEDKDSVLEDIKEPEIESSHSQNVGCFIIDTVLAGMIAVVIAMFLPAEIWADIVDDPAKQYPLMLILILLYRVFCILVFGRTPGMAICRMKYLNHFYEPLSLKERLIAIIVFKTKKIRYYKTN